MVDKVTRIMKDPDNIRNIAICAHIDHGKTTLSDNLLSGAGMMSEHLAGQARALDFKEDEAERGITIDSASVSMVHEIEGKEHLINLIDTPGHVDFGGDVTRAMRAVDGAVVLSCAVEGIMPQTETVLRQALKERVKPILFINKVDRLIQELQLKPEDLLPRLAKIIDLVNKLIISIAGEEYGNKWQLDATKGSVCFGSAFHNWALSIPYMTKKGITFKDIYEAYTQDTRKELAKKIPLHDCLLGAVIEHLPSPNASSKYRIDKLWTGDLDSEMGKELVNCDPNGKPVFVITKVVVDKQAGEISTGRVFAGTIKKGEQVRLQLAQQDCRVQQVFIYNGAKREIVDNVPAGNIIGISGLKGVPGDTMAIGEVSPFEELKHIFDPVVTKSIEAANPGDLKKLLEVLRAVGKEDPSIKIEINEETGEHLMSGMGELHLEIIENRIISEKGVKIKMGAPVVVYRESILNSTPNAAEGKSPNKHNRLYFNVEPMSDELKEAFKEGNIHSGRIKKKDQKVLDSLKAAGFDNDTAKKVRDIFNNCIFVDGTRGEVHLNEIIEMVLDMFEDVMKAGAIAKEPCTYMIITLTETKLHEDAIHRGPGQLYPAVREGIRTAILDARPVLLEPIQKIQFEAPSDYMGEISRLISNKRGQLLNMETEESTLTALADMPVSELIIGFSSDLRSATGGRGSSFVLDQRFEMLPFELQDATVAKIKQRKGL